MERNINEKMGESVAEINKDFLINEETESLYTGVYVGKVVDNNDTEQLGRCRIRVYGVFGNEIPDDELPWAMPDFDFVGGLKGSFIVPPNDCIVSVYFDQGEIYLPKYTRKVVDKNNLPADRTTDYPDMMVMFETDNGHKLLINRSTGDVKFVHSTETEIELKGDDSLKIEQNTGTKIEIDSQGNMTISGPAGKTFKLDTQQAVPTGTRGCLLGVPACVVTGAPIAGNQAFF